ncbi:GntR family transcriptional regulator [Pigmentiphaga litoralis]|uniref:DNA-binding GntR family transcriptional regulator n=1 Tax=Pigmentiphaga litoralis TaxID=516702 RepID=A0A7Y9ISU7_9BURK|nr:GntR family transcriptional regulator [Pigmentiphaga litoralis]NYE23949.1 DNA-binding GntR family transcriptional regulator [Pigmentiphaga litoralis]NYE82437.1 DNA-binding GntR family transcriptional regulator [Pigmentiphaga litoralis]
MFSIKKSDGVDDSSEPGDTLAAQLYERLRDDIILATLKPGQKLTMELLKERYDAGMTPLREALYRLSSSMLVTIENRRGFRVAPVSPMHLDEVIRTREEVETLLLRAAFENADVAWETRIVAAYHALMRASGSKPNYGPYTADWEGAHGEFHFALLSAARQPMLQDFHRSLWDHCSRYRNLAYSGRAPVTTVFDGHQQLMEAAMSRDVELGCVLLKRHITLATSHIKSAMFPGAAVQAN